MELSEDIFTTQIFKKKKNKNKNKTYLEFWFAPSQIRSQTQIYFENNIWHSFKK